MSAIERSCALHLASSAFETDKDNLGGVSPSLQLVNVGQNSERNTRTDQRPAVNLAWVGHNTPKSPSQISMLNNAPVAPGIDFNETLDRFKDELSKFVEASFVCKLSCILHTLFL